MVLPTPTLWPETADLIDIRHDTLKRIDRIYAVPPDMQELLRARQKVIAKWWDELDEEGRRYWTKQAGTDNPAEVWLFYRRVIAEDLRTLGAVSSPEAGGPLS